MTEDNKTTNTISKIHELFAPTGKGQAPAVTGQPIFKADIDYCKSLGAYTPAMIFGKRLDDRDITTCSIPLNFGSFKSTGALPHDVRLRLFALKKAISDVEIQAQYKERIINPSFDVMKTMPLYKQVLEPMLKAFNLTDFAEWIDQVQARFFFDEYEIPYILADQFDQMPMSSPLVRVPGALGLLEGTLETDDATFSPQYNTEASYIVEAKNNVVHTVITQDLLDDSAPAIIDKIRKEVLKGGVRSYERAMLDGDDSGTHIDADYQAGAANLFVKAFKGFRKLAFDNEATVGGGAIVYDHGDDTPSKSLFSELLKRLKCQGAQKDDLLYIMGCQTSHDLVTGAIPELFTAFAFGSIASNVTGQVPPVFGIKSIESALVREDLESNGKALAVPADTKTYMLIVQKSRFATWVRQATKVWAAPSLPSSDQMLMSSKTRHSFAGIPQSTTERSVIMGINIKTLT